MGGTSFLLLLLLLLQVNQVSLSTALSQEAYLLFYSRDTNYTPPATVSKNGWPVSENRQASTTNNHVGMK